MLSPDILTQFRDRADDIRVYPLSYAEFYGFYEGDKRRAWPDYYTYGEMPLVLALLTHEEKAHICGISLSGLISETSLSETIYKMIPAYWGTF